MENTPLAMSFEEIKAQADANMKADKGEAAAPGAAVQNQAAAPKQSFLDMVNEAERQLAVDETKGEEAAQPEVQTGATTAQTDNQQASGMPAGLSFDDMFKNAQSQNTGQNTVQEQATTQNTAQEQGTAQNTAQDQNAGQPSDGLSFDEMFNNAVEQSAGQSAPKEEAQVGNQGVTPAVSFDDMFAKAQAGASTEQNTAMGSFDEMLAAAQNMTAPEEAPAEEPKKEEKAVEEPKKEEAPAEEPKKEEKAVEEPKKEEAPAEEPKKEEKAVEEPKQEEKPVEETPVEEPAKEETPVEETPVEESKQEEVPMEEPKQEETKQDKKPKGKKSDSKKKEGVEPKDPLPDNTGNYKVDVLGEAQAEKKAPVSGKEESPMPEEKTENPVSMEALFTKEEIAALRANIRTFVRKELKTAMVDAMKELLTEFGE